jgi:hypothetical protein
MNDSRKRPATIREFTQLQASTRLLLNRSESADVEFKESASVLEARDFSAFANSPEGGVILIGVREIKEKGVPQRGEVIGCSVDERERRKVYDKARNNWPPVPIAVVVENTADKPIFRVDIPPGSEKPYATHAGEYVIRGDGHRQALAPQALLNFLLELEGERFLGRFQKAAEHLEDALDAMKRDLGDSLDQIQGAVESAESQQSDAMGMLDDAHGLLNEILKWSERPNGPDAHDVIDHLRIKAILDHLGIPDPALARLRAYLRREAAELQSHHLKPSPEIQEALLQKVARIFGPDYLGSLSTIDYVKEADDALAAFRAEAAQAPRAQGKVGPPRSVRRRRSRRGK